MALLRIPGMINGIRGNARVPFAKPMIGRPKRGPFRGHFGQDRKGVKKPSNYKGWLAEREGFEPPVRLRVLRISSATRSTTLPPLRMLEITWSPLLNSQNFPPCQAPFPPGG